MIVDIDTTAIPGFHLEGDPTTILLRVFALQPFTSDDGLRIIQAGTPNDGPWYKEIVCGVSGTTVSIPSTQLESQTDAFNPGEHGARYYAAFYQTDGGFIAPFDPLANFQVRHDYNPTTWQKIISYNTAPYVPAGAFQTYTRGQVDGLFKLLPGTTTGASPVTSVFGRTGAILAHVDDYDIPKITGLQAALDSKAGLPHFHNASAITSGVIAPVYLGSGLTTPTTQFLRGDGTWAVPPAGSGPGGGVNTVFGRLGPDIFALSGDYDIPKISGLQAALDGKAGLPHFHDGAAITTGFVAPARLGTSPDATKFLRGDGVWAGITGVSVDTAANYTWTGIHLFKATGATFTVQGPAGKEIIGCVGDDGVSTITWASLSLVKGTGAALIYDVDGTFNNRRSVRLDAAAIHLRGSVLSLEVSTDGVTFARYGGTSFTGGNTTLDLVATAAGSQSAGYTIGGWPALVQVYANGLYNAQALAGDFITQFALGGPGQRYGFAFNATDRYSIMIDSDSGDGPTNTPLFVRYNGQLRRIVSDSSKVLSWAVIGGDPTATGAFLRGDGVWAVPASTGPGGAVSSVGLAVDSTIFASPGPAITSSGTLSVAFAAQAASGSAGKFLAGPVSGSAVPTFRIIGASDIPALNASSITAGTIVAARLGSGTTDNTTYLRGDSTWQLISSLPGGTGSGVTSVALGAPSSVFTVGPPVTSVGTLTLGFATITPLQVLASPVSTPGVPSFRGLVAGDIPILPATVIGSGVFPPARLGSNTPGTGNFLRSDGLWAAVTGTGAVTGPAGTIAAFDNTGALISSFGSAPATFDSFNINFMGHGLVIPYGYSCNALYSNGNTANIYFVDDDGTTGRVLVGPYNSADGLTTTGLRLVLRSGHGGGDGTARGELILDSRATGGLGNASGNNLLAGAHWKGWFGINYYTGATGGTGLPFSPTAPLTIGRNDNGANLIDLRQRGAAGTPVKINAYNLIGTNERSLGAIDWSFTNTTDSTRTSQMEFWIVRNGNDIAQLQIKAPTNAGGSGLWLQPYNDLFPGDQKEVVFSNGGELPGWGGYRVLMIAT